METGTRLLTWPLGKWEGFLNIYLSLDQAVQVLTRQIGGVEGSTGEKDKPGKRRNRNRSKTVRK